MIEANGYVDAQAPWGLKKTDPERMGTVLYVLAETIRVLGLLVQPVVPESAAKMLDQLKIAKNERDFTFISDKHRLKSGTEIEVPEGVFPRLEAPEKAA